MSISYFISIKLVTLAVVLSQTAGFATSSGIDGLFSFNKSTNAKVTSTYNIKDDMLNDVSVAGLSGIAWDQDENRLYAVSDLGDIYHFNISIVNHIIQDVKLIAAYPLRDKSDKRLKGKLNDAEGLDVVNARNGIAGDTELIVAYERRPRVAIHSPHGVWSGTITLGQSLASKENYNKPNKSLETVLVHGKYGLLLVPEVAMSGQNQLHHTIFNPSGDQSWSFRTGLGDVASFSGMEELGSGDLLVLERTFDNISKPFEIILRRVKFAGCESGGVCEAETLMTLSSQENLDLDNFEGLAKIDDDRYLMISDNNENKTQQNLLSLILLQ